MNVACGPKTGVATAVAVGVPAYFSPVHDADEWAKLADLPPGSVVVINPDSGPLHGMAGDYGTAVADLQDAGMRVYGYLTLAYGDRDFDVVASDVDMYLAELGVDGVFLDQASSSLRDLGPALLVSSTYRPRGLAVALNPGQPVVPALVFDRFDEVVTFEGVFEDYLAADLPGRPFEIGSEWHLVYGVPSHRASDVVALAESRGAGFVFAAPGHLPHPWGRMNDPSAVETP